MLMIIKVLGVFLASPFVLGWLLYRAVGERLGYLKKISSDVGSTEENEKNGDCGWINDRD